MCGRQEKKKKACTNSKDRLNSSPSKLDLSVQKDIDVIEDPVRAKSAVLTEPLPRVTLPCHKKMVISGGGEDGFRTVNLNVSTCHQPCL